MPGAMQTQFASLLSLSLYFLLKFPVNALHVNTENGSICPSASIDLPGNQKLKVKYYKEAARKGHKESLEWLNLNGYHWNDKSQKFKYDSEFDKRD
ncbi:MAG: hypothetical protein P9L91_07490 [Candidatus Zophobacter franzmannii]|nr:hypothetical protein [Candidatus Zophobacter franzmannii]